MCRSIAQSNCVELQSAVHKEVLACAEGDSGKCRGRDPDPEAGDKLGLVGVAINLGVVSARFPVKPSTIIGQAKAPTPKRMGSLGDDIRAATIVTEH